MKCQRRLGSGTMQGVQRIATNFEMSCSTSAAGEIESVKCGNSEEDEGDRVLGSHMGAGRVAVAEPQERESRFEHVFLICGKLWPKGVRNNG